MAMRDERDDEVLGPDPMKAGGGYFVFGWILTLAWLAAIGAATTAFVGIPQVLAAPPIVLAAAGTAAVLPAMLVLFAAMALREGARGRAQARQLADAAERLMSPSPTAEAEARRLGVSVRGEIAALDRALDQVLHKVREVEAVIARQTLAVDSAAGMAEAGARSIVGGLERERTELLQIADDLNKQAETIGQSISRHTRLIADAARLAEAEVRAADEALDSRLSSFGAAAALISDRTHALTKAAQASAESALRLETALSTALDSLAQATVLTDAAKQSAETATFAANATAGAVRETTLRAIEDAKRAAEVIRAEANAVEQAGLQAVQRLRQAAADARLAPAEPTRARTAEAPLREPSPRELTPRELGSRDAAPREATPRELGGRDVPLQPLSSRGPDPSMTESFANPATEPKPSSRPDLGRPGPGAGPGAGPGQGPGPGGGEPGRWTWREVLAAIDDDTTSTAPARPSRAPGRPETRAETPTPPPSGRHPVQGFDAAPPTREPLRPMGEPSRDAGRDAGRDPGRDMIRDGGREEPGREPPRDPRAATPARSSWGFGMRPNGGRADDRSVLDPTYDSFRAAAPLPPGAPPPSQPTARDPGSRDPGSRDPGSREPSPRAAPESPEAALISAAGVYLPEVFSAIALERIAVRAKSGTQARRRAVREAAPDAVLRLAEHLDHSNEARSRAAAFLRAEGARISEMLGRGRAPMAAEAIRAFLLLDAASA